MSYMCISNYQGRLGNHMFQFAWAKAASIELSYNLSVPGIACDPDGDVGSLFPKTHNLRFYKREEYEQFPEKELLTLTDNTSPWITNSCLDFNLIKEKQIKNIRGIGYYQNYHAFKKHKNVIREYFTLDYNEQGKDTLALHVRLDDFPNEYRCSSEYYFKCIEQREAKNVLVFTDEVHHPFIELLKQKYSNLSVNMSYDCSGSNNKQILSYMSSCDEIVMSKSTYSWWAAFLGNAKKVYFPSTENEYFSDKNLFVDDEDRYIKVIS